MDAEKSLAIAANVLQQSSKKIHVLEAEVTRAARDVHPQFSS